MDRREFLRRTLTVGAGVGAIGTISSPAAASSSFVSSFGTGSSLGFASLAAAKNWNDPAAWSDGQVPGSNDVAVVTGPVVLTGDVSVKGIQIMDTGELYLDPASSVTIESTGNIVVHGLFSLRPTPSVVHKVRFVGVNENAYVGGGMEVLDSDVGLWVQHQGLLDAVGTPKVAWNRTGNDSTWSSSDQLIVTPTDPGDYDGFRSFSKGSAVPKARGEYSAEVLNLTRNVVFEGTAGGKAHIVFMHAMRPQTVQYVEIRHMGPRQGNTGVVGRYPIHFHHCGDDSRGSLIEGVVVHQSANRAFVPHGSHGITLRNCVAYDIVEDAFWWDLPVGGSPANNTHDSVWDSCVAAWVKPPEGSNGFVLAGFMLGHGDRNTCVNSVAVGIQGSKAASGFRWPPKGNSFHGVWRFKDNVVHNNKACGLAVWQNNTSGHHVEDTLIYQMGKFAIDHGAYVNEYVYSNITAIDCEHVINLHAQGKNGNPMRFNNVIAIDSRGADAVMNGHNLPGDGAAFFGGSLGSFRINNNPKNKPDKDPGTYDLVDTGLEPGDVTLESTAPGTVTRIQNGSQAWRIDDSGNVTSIAPFSNGDTSPPPPPATTTTTAPSNSTTTTTAASPTTTTTEVSPVTTTTQPSGGATGGNRQRRRRRRRRRSGPISASGSSTGGGTSELGGDFMVFGADAAAPVSQVESLSIASGPVQAPVLSAGGQAGVSQLSVASPAGATAATPPRLGLAGTASAQLAGTGSGPIAKQLVSRAIPVSLNVPASLGPAQPSPATPGLPSLVSPTGLAVAALAAGTVALYRRKVVTTQIPDALAHYEASAARSTTDATPGDPWA